MLGIDLVSSCMALKIEHRSFYASCISYRRMNIRFDSANIGELVLKLVRPLGSTPIS